MRTERTTGTSDAHSRDMTKRQKPRGAPPEKPQPDAGYEESHGYGPSHGGPSGPGDAPATTPARAPTPNDDDDDEK
jgi:hypothetical protein